MGKSAGVAASRITVSEIRVAHESRTVRDVPVVVVDHVMSVPVSPPVMPSPPEAAKETHSNSQAEGNPRPIEIEAGKPHPLGVIREGIPVDDPRIVFRHIDDVWIGGFNRDCLSVRCDSFLLRAFQVSSLLRPLAHPLNCIEYVLLPVHICITE
jgi:hypothetical protein